MDNILIKTNGVVCTYIVGIINSCEYYNRNKQKPK